MASYFKVTSPNRAVDQICETFQSAYDIANAIQVALGGSNQVQIIVGPVTAAQAGDLTLAANYNSNVIIVGLDPIASKLGTILSARFNVVMEASNVTFVGIDTRTAGIGGAIVTLTGKAVGGIINNSRNDAGSGSVGLVTATNWDFTSIDNSHTVGIGAAGSVVLTNCTCGDIDTHAFGVSPGSISLYRCRSIGSLINTGAAGSTTNGVIAEETNIISSAGLSAIASMSGSVSDLFNCKIKTIDTNKDCIADLNAPGISQILNCIIVPHGTGKPINASSAQTVTAYNNTFKTAVGVNVTLSGANNNVDALLRYP